MHRTIANPVKMQARSLSLSLSLLWSTSMIEIERREKRVDGSPWHSREADTRITSTATCTKALKALLATVSAAAASNERDEAMSVSRHSTVSAQ